MANPNIVEVSDIRGKTEVFNPTTTITAIVTNSAGSNEVYKVNSLIIANIVSSDSDVSVDIFRGSVGYRLASAINIPSNTTLIVVSKENSIYLEEGDSIRVWTSNNNSLQAVCSYEIIK